MIGPESPLHPRTAHASPRVVDAQPCSHPVNLETKVSYDSYEDLSDIKCAKVLLLYYSRHGNVTSSTEGDAVHATASSDALLLLEAVRPHSRFSNKYLKCCFDLLIEMAHKNMGQIQLAYINTILQTNDTDTPHLHLSFLKCELRNKYSLRFILLVSFENFNFIGDI